MSEKKNEGDLDYISIIQAMRAEARHPDTIKAAEKLFRQRGEFLQLLDEPCSERKSKAIKINIARIDDRLTEINGMAFVGGAADTLPPFDIDFLDDDWVTHYMLQVQQFHLSGNGHLVLEIFATCVANGISPPKWVMEHVGLAFDRYAFSSLGQDTSMLLKDLGLVGGASGATSPWTERETLDANFRPMMDMATLIRSFNLSQKKAAKCVIIKRNLDCSVSTMTRRLKAHFGVNFRGVVERPPEGFLDTLTGVERTKFFDSFPPEAKTIIRKGGSR